LRLHRLVLLEPFQALLWIGLPRIALRHHDGGEAGDDEQAQQRGKPAAQEPTVCHDESSTGAMGE